jgi:1-acyl-sn-glycerol-3-phosphate acyltransferase
MKMSATHSGKIVEGGPWSLGRVWRLIATGLSFAIFGIAGLFLALLWFPVIGIFVRDKAKRATIAQATVHKAWRLYVDIMRFLGVLTYEFENVDILKNCRGTIVVANHPSLLDVVFLMGFMQHTRAVIKKGVWNNPFMSGVVKASNYIPNLGSAEELIKNSSEALKDGANLCIFPEGSRTPEGQKAVYQRGFARVALDAQAPVLMVTIEVTPATLRKNEPWYSIPTSKPHWNMKVLGTIETGEESGYKRTAIGVRALTHDVQSRIEKELSL